MRKIANLFLGGLLACLSACTLDPGESGGSVTSAPDAPASVCDATVAPDARSADAAPAPDAPNVPDAAVPDAAAPDAAPTPDAGQGCDALMADAAMPDAAPTPDAAVPVDAAQPPDAPPPDTHLIYCSALDASGGRTYEFRGNVRTGLVGSPPAWVPAYMGYGSDYNGHGWPGSTPNSATNVGAIIMSSGWTVWTVAPWTFTSFNPVQGFTPYVASGSSMQWLDIPGKWTIPSGQYCTKSPGGTKICSCNVLPCTPANAVNPGQCVN